METLEGKPETGDTDDTRDTRRSTHTRKMREMGETGMETGWEMTQTLLMQQT